MPLGKRKIKEGIVLSNKMEKTVVVGVDTVLRHPRYHKVVRKRKKYYVHCGEDKLAVGTHVVIQETRPLSKTKCWRVVGSPEQIAEKRG